MATVTVRCWGENCHRSQGSWFDDRGSGQKHLPQHAMLTATPMGFEPTRAEPIGSAGRRLNHSAKVSWKHQNQCPSLRSLLRCRGPSPRDVVPCSHNTTLQHKQHIPTAQPNRPTQPPNPTAQPNRPTQPPNPTAQPNRPTQSPNPIAQPNRPTQHPTASPTEAPTASPTPPLPPPPAPTAQHPTQQLNRPTPGPWLRCFALWYIVLVLRCVCAQRGGGVASRYQQGKTRGQHQNAFF